MGFRENLKDELIYKGIQTKELAILTGISLNTLNHYLVQNATSPSVENAVKIAKALNVTVEYLVTGKIKSKSENSFSAKTFHLTQKLEGLSEHDFNIVQNMIELMSNN